MTRDAFVCRFERIYQELERLRQGSLRGIVHGIGVPADSVENLRSLRLLATLTQLAAVSADSGIPIRPAADSLVVQWNPKTQIAAMSPLFALVELRQLSDHAIGRGADERFAIALTAFYSDAKPVKSGWGLGLDRVYDGVTKSLTKVTAILAQGLWTSSS